MLRMFWRFFFRNDYSFGCNFFFSNDYVDEDEEMWELGVGGLQ